MHAHLDPSGGGFEKVEAVGGSGDDGQAEPEARTVAARS